MAILIKESFKAKEIKVAIEIVIVKVIPKDQVHRQLPLVVQVQALKPHKEILVLELKLKLKYKILETMNSLKHKRLREKYKSSR